MMRRFLAPVAITTALMFVTGGLSAAPASAVAGSTTAGSEGESTEVEEILFTVQAAHGTTRSLKVTGPEDEKFRLTLTGVDPVTVFSNRPFRDAWLISPNALDVNWNAWFAGDPPNAVLTYAIPGKAPASMVIELTNPTYNRATKSLSFTATREQRVNDPVEKGANWERLTTPTSMTSVSLFIDLTQAPEHKKEP